MKKTLLLLFGLLVFPTLVLAESVPPPPLNMSAIQIRVGCTTHTRAVFDWLKAEYDEDLILIGELTGALKTLYITRNSVGDFTLVIQNAEVPPSITCIFWGGGNLLPVGDTDLDALLPPPQPEGEET